MSELERVEGVLSEIRANQAAYEATARSWKRWLPLWQIRRQYALCKANESLFAQLGIWHDPLRFETAHGVSWAITRKLIGCR